MKKSAILFIAVFLQCNLLIHAQAVQKHPKLVVGIVIDQMRFDYLYRFDSLYSDGGFKKLMDEGSNFTFAHYNYVPTFTAPGHTSIYTGTTPYFHGIIANDWYDRESRQSIYCTSDSSVKTVGASDKNGQESPKRLLATTITDQLKLATNGKSKIISISIKDRASILPGGHMPDAAYWYDPETGNFISSTYYMKQLPEWVNDFNKRKLVDKYMSGDWELSYPLTKYGNTLPDQQPFELNLFHEKSSSFPHSFKSIPENKKPGLILYTPYGNQILSDFIQAAIDNENLGKGMYTDFLAISFSSPDYIGHSYGPNSVEIEDTYVKLDKIIAGLLEELNKQVGEGNYLLFFTGDHAVDEAPYYLNERNIPSGWFNPAIMHDSLAAFTGKTFKNREIFENLSNKQIFLNQTAIQKLKLEPGEVMRGICKIYKENISFDLSNLYKERS